MRFTIGNKGIVHFFWDIKVMPKKRGVPVYAKNRGCGILCRKRGVVLMGKLKCRDCYYYIDGSGDEVTGCNLFCWKVIPIDNPDVYYCMKWRREFFIPISDVK